ncbi:uncharacterized protein TNCV_192181 [Trichonephila clavipes]|nr:uncharacterized protein TNCV_192181 [Trichonephila clavipes]
MAEAVREAVDENDGKRDLAVAVDGSWQKRGFSSKNGLVTVTSVDTGKVIDVEVFSKTLYLSEQNQASSKLLTEAEIDRLQAYYGLAIRRNLSSVKDMQQAIWAIFLHKLSTDEKPQHGFCPSDSDTWCKFKKQNCLGRLIITKIVYLWMFGGHATDSTGIAKHVGDSAASQLCCELFTVIRTRDLRRKPGNQYLSSNVQAIDHYGIEDLMVCVGITLDGCTYHHSFERGTVAAMRPMEEV